MDWEANEAVHTFNYGIFQDWFCGSTSGKECSPHLICLEGAARMDVGSGNYSNLIRAPAYQLSVTVQGISKDNGSQLESSIVVSNRPSGWSRSQPRSFHGVQMPSALKPGAQYYWGVTPGSLTRPDPCSGSLSIGNKFLYKAAADGYHPALIITTPSNWAKDLFVLCLNYLTFIFLLLLARSFWALLLIAFYSASAEWSRHRLNIFNYDVSPFHRSFFQARAYRNLHGADPHLPGLSIYSI